MNMLNIKKQEDGILKRLKSVKRNACPNIFVSGKSVSAMEKLGIRMVEKLEEQKVLNFKGICKYFTILMPYYDSRNEAIKFMNHFLESVSIARDCYDSYCGFVLLEISEKWSEKGCNDSLDLLFDYVRSEHNIRFILLCPEGKYNDEVNYLFAEFAGCGPCIRVNAEIPTVHQCVSVFKNEAAGRGYQVSEEAEKYLYQRLKEREELKIANFDTAAVLLDQIDFNKEFSRIKTKRIELEDIMMYLPEYNKTRRIPIGFGRDYD